MPDADGPGDCNPGKTKSRSSAGVSLQAQERNGLAGENLFP
jgi:hypothetical protein